jgi:hypothetical protein
MLYRNALRANEKSALICLHEIFTLNSETIKNTYPWSTYHYNHYNETQRINIHLRFRVYRKIAPIVLHKTECPGIIF